MKRYCPSCGVGTDFTAVKPTFCGGCGKPYEGAIQTPASSYTPQYARIPDARPQIRYRVEEPEEPQRETNFDPREFAGLEVTVSAGGRNRITIGQIAQEKKVKESIRSIPREINKDELLDQMLPKRRAKGLPAGVTTGFSEADSAIEVR